MQRNSINLKLITRKSDGEQIAIMVDKIPDFKKNFLIDDLSQLVFQNVTDLGKEKIIIYPFDEFLTFFVHGRN